MRISGKEIVDLGTRQVTNVTWREILENHGKHCELENVFSAYQIHCFLNLTESNWFPWCSDGKASVCSAGDLDLISGTGRSLGEGNG